MLFLAANFRGYGRGEETAWSRIQIGGPNLAGNTGPFVWMMVYSKVGMVSEESSRLLHSLRSPEFSPSWEIGVESSVLVLHRTC
jgi:hypothetical protein